MAAELTQTLLPKTVRIIPLPVIIAILAAFIIVVGPVDYFVLGQLRLRRFTWIVFPLVSVAFTVLTMQLAAHYLGTNTHHGIFVLTDLGTDGRALRESRFELTLPPRPQTLLRETQHALVVPMSGIISRNDGPSAPVTLEGQFPARYTYRFPGQQWTPHLRRVTTFSDASDESGVNWKAFAGPRTDLHAGINAIRAKSDCAFTVLEGGQVRIDSPGPLSGRFFAQLTFPSGKGIQSIISQLSPTGAGSFDDLGMLDREDDGMVIIAIRREGRDIHAWRHLFR
jgi:hypothetical protein